MEKSPELIIEKTEELYDWSFLNLPSAALPSASVWQKQKNIILSRTIYAPWYSEISWFNLGAFFIFSCYSLIGTQVIFAAGDNVNIFNSAREIIFNSSKILSPVNLSLIYVSLFLVGSFLFFESINEKEI